MESVMRRLKVILNHPYFFWVMLYAPAASLAIKFLGDDASAEQLLHPTGEFSARFMVILMMITPLKLLFPNAAWLKWLSKRRRPLGVAAFIYALLHLVLYLINVPTVAEILAEFWALGMWTGWAAFIIFVPLAITSNDLFVRYLRRGWKKLHRWVYLAALLTLLHWVFVQNNVGPALVHFVPLVLLEAYRIVKIQLVQAGNPDPVNR